MNSQQLLILGIISQLTPEDKARYADVLNQLKTLVPASDVPAALALAYHALEIQE